MPNLHSHERIHGAASDCCLAAARALMCPATGLGLLRRSSSSAFCVIHLASVIKFKCPCWLLQDKAAQKADKDAMEAKYKFAMVDGRKEQVCDVSVGNSGSAGKGLGTDSRLCRTVIGQAEGGSRFGPCNGNVTAAWLAALSCRPTTAECHSPSVQVYGSGCLCLPQRSSGPSQAPEVVTFST